jgi:hypothetical protein
VIDISKKGMYGKIGVNGGISHTRLYNIWLKLKAKCYRITDDHYKWYGGRGITVCDEWKNDFKAFYDWAMSNGYADDLTIDRIDNNGNYCPSNCRWVDMKTQCNNRRSNILVTVDGKTLNIQQWSELTGIKYHTLYMRYMRGKRGTEFLKGVG